MIPPTIKRKINMPYITHKLGKTFYKSKGKISKTNLPIVMLHGGPGGTSSGMEAFFELSKDRKVFIYDQLGSGKSSKTTKKHWNIKTFVAELEYLLKAWKIDEFILFGASWGTTLALEFYNRQTGIKKKNIKALIFQSPMFSGTDWENDGKTLIKKMPKQTQVIINTCHKINATDAKVYQDAMMEYYLKHVLRDKKKLMKLFKETNSMNMELYNYMWGPSEFKPTGTLKTYNKVSTLKKIKTPTLFICGEYDEATPKTTKRYAKLVKDSKCEVVGGASHCIAIEKPKKLNSVICSFLKEMEQ
jgi:proline iminopeptidase